MLDHRKQAVSIRLGEGDLRNIKRMAKRLGVRDSDIIRFAVKSMLNRNAPLCDEAIHGRNLVPLMVESGDDLIRYFELDSFRLETIINDRAEEESKVHREDIALAGDGRPARAIPGDADEGQQRILRGKPAEQLVARLSL